MKKLVLVGSGGCMREILWQIEEYNKFNPAWSVEGYVDAAEDLNMESVGICPYLGDESYLLNATEPVNVAICVTDPRKRALLVEKYKRNENITFPSIMLSREGMGPGCSLGQGCIVSRGCTLSSNVVLSDFVFLNMGCIICHDSSIGAFTTLSSRVTVLGNVDIGEGCYLSVGASTSYGIKIEDDVVVEAMAMVDRDIPAHAKVTGITAKIE